MQTLKYLWEYTDVLRMLLKVVEHLEMLLVVGFVGLCGEGYVRLDAISELVD